MALPPERITVKRRRDEEPIEALYIQPKKYRPSALWTLAGNENDTPSYADPAASSRTFGELQPSRVLDPRVPIIRTTLSSEDVSRQPRVPINPSMSPVVKDHAASSPIIRPLRCGQGEKKITSEPRKFHLSRSYLPVTSPYLVSKTPAQKHRKSGKRDLAVFVEKDRKVKPMQRITDVSVANTLNAKDGDIAKSENVRKRPNATLAERKWRADNWDKPGGPTRVTHLGTRTASNVNDALHQWDYESPELAEQLQQIALQEVRAQEEKTSYRASVAHLKTKPKPPKPRLPAVQCNVHVSDEDDIMADVGALGGDDYVFDTYVRSHAHAPGMIDAATPLDDSLQHLDSLGMGVLVIEEGEDEDVWETFGGDPDSDSDWNSEEDDENAEDFYGNDYPEDEVTSDDEFGRSAYNYRHGASDDEEFDEEEPSWSDEEADPKPPWALSQKHALESGDQLIR